MKRKKKTTTFGLHLMLDAYGVDRKKLDDMKRVYKFLDDVPDMIGMTQLGLPVVVDVDASGKGKDPGGISGFVIVAESHVSVHTFAKRGFFTMDVYSCKNFKDQIDKLMAYVKKMFPYKEKELRVVKRGLKYPVENIKE